jgi:hypothetical protein
VTQHQREPKPPEWFVKTGIVATALAVFLSVALSIMGGARWADTPEVIAAALPLAIVLPISFMLMRRVAIKKRSK